MSNKGSDDAVTKLLAGVFVVVVVLISVIPKPVWILIGVLALAAAVVGLIVWAFAANEKRRAEQAAAAERAREEKAREEKQQRVAALGRKNARLVESALAAVKQLGETEAAHAGWLGDVDFTADIREITDNFQKAHDLLDVVNKLSALDRPSADDRKILAEARTTAANLERAACERVELVERCAKEARLIDESLRNEREELRTAEQRAALHGRLSAMLYGIEATPDAAPKDSAADAVMARVQAYREIKNQIRQARDR